MRMMTYDDFMPGSPAGTMIGGFPRAHTEKVILKERKTHRHLARGERAKNGDVYGGEDMGFLFEVGTESTSMKEGDLVDWAVCYRIRRRL